MKDKIKNLFVEQNQRELHQVQVRAAIKGRTVKEELDDSPVEVKVRDWVKSSLATAPWLALAIVLFGIFAQGAIAASALGYGLLKVAIAVTGTVIADETMFRGQKECKQSGWVPMMRRAMVFMGICWLMAVT